MSKAVLLVGNFLSETVVYGSVGEELARRLADRGWSVLLTSKKVNRARRIADMVMTAWAQRRCYDVAHVDVFSGSAFFWAEAVCTVLRHLHKPYVLTLRGGGLPEFASRRPERVKRLLCSAVNVTAPSGYLLHRMKAYREDIVLLANPLEIDKYEYRARSAPRPRLMWLRAFHDIYNPSLLPATMGELTDHPSVEAFMVGPDKRDGSLERAQRKAAELGLGDRIVFPGPVPKRDISLWLNRGDIFVNTSNIDNTPTSVLEAMACGLCVVSTNVGGIPYLLEDQSDALLVPPNDPAAMAAAMRRILTEPGLAARLSSNARRKVEQFDWSHILPQWEGMLSRILEEA